MHKLSKKPENKQGQVWTLDYFVGLFIFLVIIFTAITLLRNISNDKDKYSETIRESEHIAAMLLRENIEGQNASNLTNPAVIALNNRVNLTLLEGFDNISYAKSKLYFQSSGDYIFYFFNGTVINQSKCFRGYNLSVVNCSINQTDFPSDASNIAKTERVVILNSQIVKLVVISWN